jgi:hypothetical protein
MGAVFLAERDDDEYRAKVAVKLVRPGMDTEFMGLTYAALLHSPVRPPGDRENALSWLSKADDAWRAAQSDGALAAPDRREMRQVEEALTRIERR